jgi:hypothetical protein
MSSTPLSFPLLVETFLDPSIRHDSVGCLTSLCSGPAATTQFLTEVTDRTEGGEGDDRMANLILSGLLQACIDGIETPCNCQKRPVDFSKTLFHIGIQTDAPWLKIADARPDSNTSLIGLAMLKMVISSIRFLGRHNGRHRDDEMTIVATRMLGRSLSQYSGQDYDYDLLSTGANVQKWERAAELAKEEYESGGVASKFIIPNALSGILAPLSDEDRALLRWMIRPLVFSSIGGWINAGAFKRSPEVASTSNSWQRVRELLLVGYRGSTGRLSGSALDKETVKAANKLRSSRMEQYGGSTIPMPVVYLPCGAEGCKMPGEHTCSRCKTVAYCSKECQKSAWKCHKKDCASV